LGIPEAIAGAMDFQPRAQKIARSFFQLLDLWDSAFMASSHRPPEIVFPSFAGRSRLRFAFMADSGIGKRRAAFQALRKAVGFLHVMLPAKNGAAAKSGQPQLSGSARGPQTSYSSRPLKAIVPDREMNLSAKFASWVPEPAAALPPRFSPRQGRT